MNRHPNLLCQNLFAVTGAVLLAAAPVGAHAQEATAWKAVDRGMSVLLDEGWKIESVSHNQVFKREREREHAVLGTVTAVLAIAIASVPDGNEYNFLLSKGSKWVVCVVSSPRPDGAFSRCRGLN